MEGHRKESLVFANPSKNDDNLRRSNSGGHVKVENDYELQTVGRSSLSSEYVSYTAETYPANPSMASLQYRCAAAVLVTASENLATISSQALGVEGFGSVLLLNALSRERNCFQFKVTRGGLFAIGLAPKSYPLHKVMPGWNEGSYAYHSNGNVFVNVGSTSIAAPRFDEGDLIGCGLDFSETEKGFILIWFTKNNKLVYWPEKIPYQPSLSLHPIISVGDSGEVTYIYETESTHKPLPNTSSIYPWYITAGFSSESEVPFRSKEYSREMYGLWDEVTEKEKESTAGSEATHTEATQPETAHNEASLFWEEVRDNLWCSFPQYLRKLGTLCPPTYAEWVDLAEEELKKNEKFAQAKYLPTGQDWKKGERIALFLADQFLSTLKYATPSRVDVKKIAILGYLSLGITSLFQVISTIGGLLFMDCSPDSCIKKHHVLHNPDLAISVAHLILDWAANPNTSDAQGRAPLHLHQQNRELLRVFLDHNANIHALDDVRHSPLHYAAATGRMEVVDLLMEKGASPSADYGRKLSSMDVAASAGHFDCFKHMLTHSVGKIALQQKTLTNKWTDAVSHLPKWKKVNLAEVEEISNPEFYCVSVKQKMTDSSKYSVRKLVSVAAENQITLPADVLTTVFDRCLYGQNVVVADILDADVNGDVDPTNEEGDDEGQSLLTYLSKRPNLLLSLVNHDTLKAYIDNQWKRKSLLIFSCRVIFYVLQLILLTMALSIAARPEVTDADLNTYSAPIDIVRAVCEITTVIILLATILNEILEMIMVPFVEYLSDIEVYINWSSTVLVLSIIPLRVVDNPGQWIVVSLAYLMFASKSLYFASLLNVTGQYVQVLAIVISRDVVKFLCIFVIILVILGGAFYFSLRYDVSVSLLREAASTLNESSQSSESSFLPGETSLLHEVYFTGLRTLFEGGPTLTYLSADGSGGFGVLGVIWYMLFVFIVVTILLNVLIAQLSDSYAKILEKADGYKLFHQCLYTAKMEQQGYRILMSRGVYVLLKKSWFCRSLYKCCCCCFPKRLFFWTRKTSTTRFARPNIISIGKEKNSPNSNEIQSLSQRVKAIAGRYLPDILEVSESGQGADDFDDDIESKLGSTNLNLKELGETVLETLDKQKKAMETFMRNNQSVLMSELSHQRKKLHVDVNLSEEQELKTTLVLARLGEIETALNRQIADVKDLVVEKESEMKKEMASQEERLCSHMKSEVTTQEQRLEVHMKGEIVAQERRFCSQMTNELASQEGRLSSMMTQQQKDITVQFPRQKEEIASVIEDKVQGLSAKIGQLQHNLATTKQEIVEQNSLKLAAMKTEILEESRKLSVSRQSASDLP